MLLYLLLKAGSVLAAYLPYTLSSSLFKIIFGMIYTASPNLQVRVKNNYRKIVPEWPDLKVKQTARSSFVNYGIFCLEFLLNSTARGKSKFKLISPQSTEAVIAELNALDSGILLATSHFGNWEVGGEFLKSYFPQKKIYVVADGLFSGYGQFVKKTREKNGFIVLDSLKDVRQIFKALNEKHVVCILFDRPLINSGIRMNIGASWMNVPEGIPRIAKKTNCAITFAFGIRNQEGKYEGYFSPTFLTPQQINQKNNEEITEYLSEQWNQAFKKYPESWYMFRNIN